jgi:hypothetical protein
VHWSDSSPEREASIRRRWRPVMRVEPGV